MTSLRSFGQLWSCALVLGVAACAAPPPPPPAAAAVRVPARVHPAPVPPDWFHRQLAEARRAKIGHLPPGDSVGALRAYYAVMVPVCEHVAKAGPAKYRARCRSLIERASNAVAAAAYNPPCDDDHDDSDDTPAQITACSD